MANTIKIKRSTTSAQPANSALAPGELAYSSSSGKLFIGHPDGTTAAPQHIATLLPVEGTLTAQKPIVPDSNSKIDILNVDNITIDGNAITSASGTNGNINITPDGTGAVQVSKFQIGDPSSTGYAFPTATGSENQILSVDSNGDLVFAASVSGANDATITISGGTGLKTGGAFTTDQSSNETITLDLDVAGLTAVTDVAQTDQFIMADASDTNNEKKITFSTLEDAVFGNISGDATVAAGGALTIATGVIENGMMADDSVDSAEIVDGAIDTVHIADDQVTNAKLANITRGSVKVGGALNAPTDLDAKTDGYILVGDGTDVNSVAVSGDVTLSNAGAVTIADNAVTNAKLADITRGSIKVGGTSNVPTDLDAKTDGYILVGNGTDVNSVAVSGDVALSNTGAVTIADNAVTTAKINALAVTNAKIAADAIDGTKIADDAINSEHITDGSVDNIHLANESVTVGSTAINLGSSATTIDGLNTVHGIDAAGTDAAGTDLTIKAGGGTGTGAGGEILFQVADGGSTGSSVNTFATALTIADNGDITAAQNFTVSGNLTVSGTTTTVNSETVTFDDNILVLNNNFSGSSPTENAGIEVERGTLDNVAFRWNETSDKWQITEDGSAYKNLIHNDSDIDGGTY
jgi:hypothetical protein